VARMASSDLTRSNSIAIPQRSSLTVTERLALA